MGMLLGRHILDSSLYALNRHTEMILVHGVELATIGAHVCAIGSWV